MTPLHDAVEDVRRQMVRDALDAADGNLSAAARMLSVSTKTMWRLAERYAGRRPQPFPGRPRRTVPPAGRKTVPPAGRLSAAEIARRYGG